MKKFLLIFGLLIVSVFNNRVYGQEANDVNIDTSQMTTKQAFYFTHKWVFIENYLMEYPESDCHTFCKNLSKILVFLSTGALPGLVSGAILIEPLQELGISLGLCIGVITGAFSVGAYSAYLKHKMDKKWLIYFLERYNPSVKFYDVDNFKNYTPESLQPAFDILWKEYQQKGRKAIDKGAFDMLCEIREEIRFRINPEKYKPKPEIHNHNYNYVYVPSR